jgi:hypothetical protein
VVVLPAQVTHEGPAAAPAMHAARPDRGDAASAAQPMPRDIVAAIAILLAAALAFAWRRRSTTPRRIALSDPQRKAALQRIEGWLIGPATPVAQGGGRSPGAAE